MYNNPQQYLPQPQQSPQPQPMMQAPPQQSTPGMNLQSLAQNLRVQQNPMAFLEAMTGHDPTINRAVQMMQGKSGAEIWELAGNLAQSQGTTLEQVIGSLGV